MRSGCDFRPLQPNFLGSEDVDDHWGLMVEFEGTADAVAHTTSAEGVIDCVLLGP